MPTGAQERSMPPLPDPDGVVVPRLLERNARARPDDPFARFEDGAGWTCADAREAAARAAGRLAAAGVAPGDRVAVFGPNSADWLRAWWGATWLWAARGARPGALAAGAQIAVRGAPSVSSYWAVAKQTGATIALGVSTMAAFLLAQPPGPGDRDPRLRIMAMSPLPPDPPAFVERF